MIITRNMLTVAIMHNAVGADDVLPFLYFPLPQARTSISNMQTRDFFSEDSIKLPYEKAKIIALAGLFSPHSSRLGLHFYFTHYAAFLNQFQHFYNIFIYSICIY